MPTVNKGVDSEDLKSLPSYQEYWKADRGSPPQFLMERSTQDLGNAPIAKELFTSREWHLREMDRLWKRVWQVACRENEIPNTGDWIAYDIGDQSLALVRQPSGEVRAFHNVCPHRGNRLLMGEYGHVDEIVCPYHAWSWNLDGSIKRIMCRWDFPDISDNDVHLVEVATGSWDGWIFVNLDPNAEPLEEFLGPDIINQWAHFPRTHAWKAAHVGKVLPCNWKLALQSSMEAYHIVGTHPQWLGFSGDCITQYDFYGPHSRFIIPNGVPSPYLSETEEQSVVDAMFTHHFPEFISDGIPQLQPGQSARDALADFMKGRMAQMGMDVSSLSDTVVLDPLGYIIFPNFAPFGGYGYPLVTRYRPNGDDHESCIFEMILLLPLPESIDLPPDEPLRMTPTDEPWMESKEFGQIARPIDQDTENLRQIQRAHRSDGLKHVLFSNYQERNIRNFHQHLARYLGT